MTLTPFMSSANPQDSIPLLDEIRACRLCEAHLPRGPRPVVQLHPNAKILIVGQAPGRRVHDTGIPFNDPSGDRLREWMGVSRELFYNPQLFAIVPMGFCFPGTGKSGDLPPRPECATTWRAPLLNLLDNIELTIVLGKYAQDYHFDANGMTVTELVKSWRDYWPDKIALPHPSPRNNLWLRRNPWFEGEMLPPLQAQVSALVEQHKIVLSDPSL